MCEKFKAAHNGPRSDCPAKTAFAKALARHRLRREGVQRWGVPQSLGTRWSQPSSLRGVQERREQSFSALRQLQLPQVPFSHVALTGVQNAQPPLRRNASPGHKERRLLSIQPTGSPGVFWQWRWVFNNWHTSQKVGAQPGGSSPHPKVLCPTPPVPTPSAT